MSQEQAPQGWVRAGSGLTSGRSWISRTFLGCCPLPGRPLADPAPSHTVQGTLTPGLREVEDRSSQQGRDSLCHMWPQGRVGANRSLRSWRVSWVNSGLSGPLSQPPSHALPAPPPGWRGVLPGEGGNSASPPHQHALPTREWASCPQVQRVHLPLQLLAPLSLGAGLSCVRPPPRNPPPAPAIDPRSHEVVGAALIQWNTRGPGLCTLGSWLTRTWPSWVSGYSFHLRRKFPSCPGISIQTSSLHSLPTAGPGIRHYRVPCSTMT